MASITESSPDPLKDFVPGSTIEGLPIEKSEMKLR